MRMGRAAPAGACPRQLYESLPHSIDTFRC